MAEKPIFVAGKSGQLARCLRDVAVLRNLPMVAVGRPELDLENGKGIDRVMAAVEPSAIVNAAAYTAVDAAEAEPERAFGINRDGAARLADAAARHGIPFIQISTDYVFDGSKPSPYREDDITAPLNVYGSSKLASETAVLKACPCAAVIRTSWVYSPYGNNFVRTMLRLSETQPMVRVVDDQRGTPTSAADLAAAVLAVVEHLRSANGCDNAGTYHLAGEGETSWHGFAAAIFASLARRGRRVPRLQAITTAEYPTPARRPQNSCLDSSRAERIFGVRLPSWRSSLEICLDQLEMPKESHAC
ncbi:MAG: dTDP-4-dehydrorhamnose reductase [Bradyrhizobium sp.]|jgi:dTDP-4-dehydrorhamnose reductase|nr:dTDP-4-dehydrorhamnose reductase [Bradyrhizobium sp.]